jgi:hypothetical protein
MIADDLADWHARRAAWLELKDAIKSYGGLLPTEAGTVMVKGVFRRAGLPLDCMAMHTGHDDAETLARAIDLAYDAYVRAGPRPRRNYPRAV